MKVVTRAVKRKLEPPPAWGWKRSMARPAFRAKAARSMSVKLAAGPARAIQAERLG